MYPVTDVRIFYLELHLCGVWICCARKFGLSYDLWNCMVNEEEMKGGQMNGHKMALYVTQIVTFRLTELEDLFTLHIYGQHRHG